MANAFACLEGRPRPIRAGRKEYRIDKERLTHKVNGIESPGLRAETATMPSLLSPEIERIFVCLGGIGENHQTKKRRPCACRTWKTAIQNNPVRESLYLFNWLALARHARRFYWLRQLVNWGNPMACDCDWYFARLRGHGEFGVCRQWPASFHWIRFQGESMMAQARTFCRFEIQFPD